MAGLGLAELRARVRALEGWAGETARRALPLGLPAIDRALGGGLWQGCLHEIEGPGADSARGPGDGAATGFAAALAAHLAAPDRPALWVCAGEPPHAPGLTHFGLTPDRLILARVRRRDLLWVLEEAARSTALAAVVGEVEALTPTASRRLQLAAEQGRATLLLLRRPGGRGVERGSVAASRWRAVAAPGRTAAEEPGVGEARWRLDLLRCRGGQPGGWLVEWGADGWRLAGSEAPAALVLAERRSDDGRLAKGAAPAARAGSRHVA